MQNYQGTGFQLLPTVTSLHTGCLWYDLCMHTWAKNVGGSLNQNTYWQYAIHFMVFSFISSEQVLVLGVKKSAMVVTSALHFVTAEWQLSCLGTACPAASWTDNVKRKQSAVESCIFGARLGLFWLWGRRFRVCVCCGWGWRGWWGRLATDYIDMYATWTVSTEQLWWFHK